MAVSLLEFCTPPVPGESHQFYGNAHNRFIKLPISLQPVIVTEVPAIAKSSPVNNNNKQNNNSLHSIVTSGNLTLLNNILSVLPNPQKAVNDPHSTTGLTPLHFASSRGHFDIVQCLVEQYSAIVDAKDKEGETALLKAAYSGHFHIVKYLVSKNANIHLKDKDGWTGLHNACARGHLQISRLLIESGAHVDVKSKMGHTPLINAASKGYISIVEYLLDEAHANPLIKNNFGEAAYDVAAAATESHICDILYKSGVSWWEMQHMNEGNNGYNLLDFHVTVMVVLHENERSSSLLGLSKPQFSAASLSKYDTRGPWSRLPSGEPCTKDQLQLPQNENGNGSDWFWLTDWQIDYSDPRIDPTSGWQYARGFKDPDESWTPVTPTSGYGWVRRRKWVRVMKRRMDLLKGNHIGSMNDIAMNDEDYLCEAEDIVQNSKLDPSIAASEEPSIQQLTSELRALEEAVQLIRAGIKKDGNQYRIHQANTLITLYSSQIETLNTRISHLAHALSTPITPQPVQHNAELARELGFKQQKQQQQEQQKSDFDVNPWSRDSANASWAVMESTSFNPVDLIGHGMDHEEASTSNATDEPTTKGPKQYVWEYDADVKDCRGCRRKFGFLMRRHHCRCCGLIHCDRCSMSRAYLDPTQILQDPNGILEPLDVLSSYHQRVCDTCYAKLTGIPPP